MQRVGDVVIGTSVFLYDRRKVKDKKRGFETSYSPIESPVERGAQNDWITIFEKWGRKNKKKIGCVLTGGAIVESKKFRDSLRKKANKYLKDSGTSRRVVGGEMEAAGLTVLSATAPRALSWVVVKAVMDFGTAASRTGVQSARQTAATNAVDAVFQVLRFAV
jgi:nucleoside phosphorylase